MSQASCSLPAPCVSISGFLSLVTVLESEEGFAGREQSCRNWKSPRATNKRRLVCTWTCRAGGKAEEHKHTAEGDDWASIRSGRCRSHHNEITLHYFPLPPFCSSQSFISMNWRHRFTRSVLEIGSLRTAVFLSRVHQTLWARTHEKALFVLIKH
jgi:hypothetical protein